MCRLGSPKGTTYMDTDLYGVSSGPGLVNIVFIIQALLTFDGTCKVFGELANSVYEELSGIG